MLESEDTTHVCTGECRRKTPALRDVGKGSALLGLALGVFLGCGGLGPVQPAYGVPLDDDDDSATDDDDSGSADDDDAGV